MQLSEAQVENIVNSAIAEDTGQGDMTSEAVIPPDLQGRASVLVKASGVLAGIDIARMVFLKINPSIEVKIIIPDGQKVQPGDVVATVEGDVVSILKAERTALNFLQRMSGIATETARYIEATRGLPVHIADTRKTAPGLRPLEKYAVRTGGGQNHRQHMGDGIIIKDNHLAALSSQGMGLREIVARAKQNTRKGLKIEVEVKTPEEALEAIDAGADMVMLDNMSLSEMRRTVELVRGRALIEASGGITLDNVRQAAETGVDLISVGALTHSAKALDISLELEPR